jgi:tRNA A-37 threonylcarbamoyl transferase component Bud32
MINLNYYFIKTVLHEEYIMYKYISNLNFDFVPKLYNYDKISKELKTQKINGMSVSDMYGDKRDNVPTNIQKKIYDIIFELYKNNIIYPDITGYNFIQDKNNKIWIVDFEHCFYLKYTNSDKLTEKQTRHVTFVKEFIDKKQIIWNPDFY